MNVLFIIRGLPGCGKTTLAKSIAPGAVCQADDFFVDDETGKYEFVPHLLNQAHNECYLKCYRLMNKNEPKIAVCNTGTREWEFKDYIELAKAKGYMVHVMVVEHRHGGENTHGVPQDAIDKMKRRFEVSL